MKTRLLFLSLLTLALLAATFSQPQRMMGQMMAEGPRIKFMQELNLTDAQKKDFEKLHFDNQKEMIDLRSKMAKSRLDLQQLMRADSPDKAAIDKKLGELSQIQLQMQQKKVNQWFAVNKLLTPDQQKVWKRALDRPGFKRGRGRMMQQFMHGCEEKMERFRHRRGFE